MENLLPKFSFHSVHCFCTILWSNQDIWGGANGQNKFFCCWNWIWRFYCESEHFVTAVKLVNLLDLNIKTWNKLCAFRLFFSSPVLALEKSVNRFAVSGLPAFNISWLVSVIQACACVERTSCQITAKWSMAKNPSVIWEEFVGAWRSYETLKGTWCLASL